MEKNQLPNQEAAGDPKMKRSANLAATMRAFNYPMKMIWLLSHADVPWR